MGVNWDHSYNIYIEADGENLILHDGNSRCDLYLKVCGQDRWRAHGLFREITRESDGTYTVTFVHNTKWRLFPLDSSPTAGKLRYIDDRHGDLNRTILYYDTQGRLITIEDAVGRTDKLPGREVHIEYNPAGYVSRVIDFASEYADPNLVPPDARGRVIQYGYDGDGNLTSVTYPADIVPGHPELVRFPQGTTTTYTYSSGSGDPALNHNLLTITDGRGNDPGDPVHGQAYLVNTYGVTGEDFDRVKEQRLGNATGTVGGTFHYTYQTTALDAGLIMKATILDRAGNQEELFYRSGNLLVKRTEYTNRDVRPGEGDYTTLYDYNADSLLTWVLHPNGNSVTHKYDSQNPSYRSRGNRIIKRQLPGPLGGDQEEICERWAYGGRFNFVTSYADPHGGVTSWDYDGEDLPGALPASCADRSPPPSPPSPDRGGGTGDLGAHHCIFRFYKSMPLEEGPRRDPPGQCRGDHEWDAFGRLLAETNDVGRRDEYTYVGDTAYVATATIDSPGFALTTSHSYDTGGTPLSTTDPKGYTRQLLVNALGQVVRTIAPAPFLFTKDFRYDANGNSSRVDVLNVDENGAAGEPAYLITTHEYDLLDRRTRTSQNVDSSHDAVTEYQYDANENRTLLRYPEAVSGRQPNNTVAQLYDERDLLFRQTSAPGDPRQSTTQLDYDDNRNLTTRSAGIEGVPHTYPYHYDGYNRLWAPSGLPASLDPMGNATVQHYDETGNIIETSIEGELIDGESGPNVLLARTLWTYDSWDFADQTHRWFSPDPAGDGWSTTNHIFNDIGQSLCIEDDNGHGTTIYYDSANRPRNWQDSAVNQHRIMMPDSSSGYDANSNPVALRDRDKLVPGYGNPVEVLDSQQAFDQLNRLIETTDPAGAVRRLAYDSRNQRVLESLIGSDGVTVVQQTRYVYDGLGRLVQTIIDLDGDGANVGDADDIIVSQVWDDDSRLIAQIDDNGNATRYAYDALNRKIITRFADGTFEQVGTGTVVWPDGELRPTDLSGFTSGYDVHGNALVTKDGNDSVVTNQYDLLNRLTTRTIAPGVGVSSDTTWEQYKYDGLSRVVYAADNDSVVTRQYDSLGNIIEERLSFDGGTSWQTVTTEHDGVGNVLRLVYPSGRDVRFSYDELNRIAAVSDDDFATNIASYQYLGPYRVKQRDYKNNTRMTYSYDIDQYVRKVAGTTHSFIGGAAFDRWTYTWSDGCAGCGGSRNKTSRSNLLYPSGPLTYNYYYDRANRMVRTIVDDNTPPAPPVAPHLRDTVYELDGVHNRQAVSETGTLPSIPGDYVGSYWMNPTLPEPADYQMNQHTLAADGGPKPQWQEYDKNGNLIRRQDPAGSPQYAQLTYDYRNQMVQYADPVAGQTHEYKYDCFRRRIAKIVNVGPSQVETRYINGGQAQWQVLEEQDAVCATVANYVYGNYIDEPLTMRRDVLAPFGTPEDYYYHQDDLFNVMALTNSAGSVVERYDYRDYGLPLFFNIAWVEQPAGSGLQNDFLFTGRQHDQEQNSYWYRTRVLEPINGLFLSRDSIGGWTDEGAKGNARVYVGSNPHSALDPIGTLTCGAYDNCTSAEVCRGLPPGSAPRGCRDPNKTCQPAKDANGNTMCKLGVCCCGIY